MDEDERLWEVDDQRGRLDELTARAEASKKAPLRRDVRSLRCSPAPSAGLALLADKVRARLS